MRSQKRSTNTLRIGSLALTVPLVCLAACNGSGAQEAGPVSEDEAQALGKAAEMLEDPRMSLRQAEDAGAKPPLTESDEKEGL